MSGAVDAVYSVPDEVSSEAIAPALDLPLADLVTGIFFYFRREDPARRTMNVRDVNNSVERPLHLSLDCATKGSGEMKHFFLLIVWQPFLLTILLVTCRVWRTCLELFLVDYF